MHFGDFDHKRWVWLYLRATVTISDADGAGATGIATISAGAVTGITIESGGSGYVAPTISFTGGGGTGAAATAIVGYPQECIGGITITNGGSGYTAGVTVSVSGGGGNAGAAVAVLSGGVVQSITVTNGGSGYSSAPAISISGGGGSGATATASVSGGLIQSITVTNGGSGYTAGPTVTFTGGGGTGAAAVLNISGGVIQSASMANCGSGYTSTPTVSISGGGGSGATGTAVLWNVTWSSPNIYLANPGTGTSTVVTPNPNWTGYGSGSAGGPYMMAPGTPAFLNWNNGTSTGLAPFEFVTSTPHNLKTGQLVSLYGLTPVPFSNGRTATTVQSTISGFTVTIYVTGPTTFVTSDGFATSGTGLSLPGGMNTIPGSFPVNYTGTLSIPDSTVISYESAAQISGSFPGCNFWCNVPPSGNRLVS